MKCPVVNCRNIQVGELTVSEPFGESMARVAKSTGVGCDLDVRCTDEKLVSVMITPKPSVPSDPRKGPHAVVFLHACVVEEVWIEPDEDAAYKRLVKVFESHGLIGQSGNQARDITAIQELTDGSDYSVMPINRPCKVLAVPVGAA